MSSENLTPAILNVAITLADTQYSQVIPAGTKHFTFKLRDATKTLRFAWDTLKVQPATAPYATLAAGQAYASPEKICLVESSKTIYFASPDASQVVEIVYWS